MGMYDSVHYEGSCPFCGVTIPAKSWQTKDLDCMLDVVELTQPGLWGFYTSCDGCGEWVEYRRLLAPATGIEDFECITLPAPTEEAPDED